MSREEGRCGHEEGDLVVGEEMSSRRRRSRCGRGDVVTKKDAAGGEEMSSRRRRAAER
jgi:hypothetical protein